MNLPLDLPCKLRSNFYFYIINAFEEISPPKCDRDIVFWVKTADHFRFVEFNLHLDPVFTEILNAPRKNLEVFFILIGILVFHHL